jgi:outer membrane protein TolC
MVWVLAAAGTGCSTAHYRQSADREIYDLLAQKQQRALGQTNAFRIETAWSQRDPLALKAEAIIKERFTDAGRLQLSLDRAFGLAVTNSRAYQLRREQLYLSALALTGTRHQFEWRVSSATADIGVSRSTDRKLTGTSDASATLSKLFQTGASFTASVANDLTLYFNGTPKVPSLTLALTQPLLRGAGADIAAEALTQAERDVIYEVRSFSHYQETFAADIVTTYYRLLQKKAAVRNAYENYLNLARARERAEALAFDRLPAFQVDQARQEEYKSKVAYIAAVESYQTSLDAFKQSLALPLGTPVALDDRALDDLTQAGLLPLPLDEQSGFEAAIHHRLDLLNEIDKFEDSKRKIVVAANQLAPGLDFVTDASLANLNYSNFDVSKYSGNAGLRLNLPFGRLNERNAYRSSLIHFEKQIRSLATALDGARDAVRQGLRTLDQMRQNYQIQQNALELAKRRVESADLLLQAGRAQIRDQLEAQQALVAAQNAVTAALVDYHAARLKMLIDVGALRSGGERFWLRDHPVPGDRPVTPPAVGADREVITPDQLFGN